MNIQTSTIEKEGPYLASKFHHLYFFLHPDELKELFEGIEFSLHPLGGVLKENQLIKPFKEFFLEYAANHRVFFDRGIKNKSGSFILTKDLDALYKVKCADNQYLLKIKKPVLFLKPCFFSICENKILSTLGDKAVYWGYCLSYPQVYQSTHFAKVDASFMNTSLFIHFRKKLRKLSKAVTLLKNTGEKIVSPYRLGKKLLHKSHPCLLKEKIRIDGV